MSIFTKKYWTAGLVAGTLLCSGMAYAASGIKLTVDGKEILSEVPPQIIDGTTLVPARYLAEALGADVKWDGTSQTVIVSSKEQQSSAKFSYKGTVFTVDLPLEWEGRLDIEEHEKETLFYYLPKAGAQERKFLFSIDKIGKEQWTDMEEAGFFTALGNLGDFVYALHTPSENPYAATPDSEEYKETWGMLTRLKSSIGFTMNGEEGQANPGQGVVLTGPEQAAEMYAFGLQQRNASIQFAVFSESMKKSMLPEFERLGWVTGVSSPWITKWEATQKSKADEHTAIVEVRLDTATSTGADAPIILTVTLLEENGRWLVNGVTADRELPESGINGKEAASSIPAFDVNDAVQLAAKAAAGYWHISTGGGGTTEGEVKEFAIPGKGDHYRWMGEELGTKAKLVAFLDRIFTPDKVKEYWSSKERSGEFAEVDGRLAQANADGGSLVSWADATATLAEDGTLTKKYVFAVPVGGTETKQYELTFRYVDKQGWRLDEDVSKIR